MSCECVPLYVLRAGEVWEYWGVLILSPFRPPCPRGYVGETPLKLREDLEKSLTDLNNLSLSICNSEVSVYFFAISWAFS